MSRLACALSATLCLVSIVARAAAPSEAAPLSAWRNYSAEERQRIIVQIAQKLKVQAKVTAKVTLPTPEIIRCVDFNRTPDEQEFGGRKVRMTVGGAVQVCVQTYVPGLRAVQLP